jgi:NADPH-dependent glutamate synthase beta subunit-like oxidoreductase
VAVVGGGNSAVDVGRTALRLGAREVTILYRRDRGDMPADAHEITEAIAEGVRLQTLVMVGSIVRAGDGLDVTCLRARPGAFDDSGRRRSIPIEGSAFTARYDTVVAAVGQHPRVPAAWGLEAGPGEQIVVAPGGLRTAVEGVFAGGDAVTGPSTVVAAIAHGRAVASEIDRYLGGDGCIDESFAPPDRPVELEPLAVATGELPRTRMPAADARTRIRSFDEVELGYSREEAKLEANRCLRCDLGEVRV